MRIRILLFTLMWIWIFVCFVYFHIFITYIPYIHSITIQSSFAIRWNLAPFPHRSYAQWGNLPVVSSQESNSGLTASRRAANWATTHHIWILPFTLMRILIQLPKRMRIRIRNTAYYIPVDVRKIVPKFLIRFMKLLRYRYAISCGIWLPMVSSMVCASKTSSCITMGISTLSFSHAKATRA